MARRRDHRSVLTTACAVLALSLMSIVVHAPAALAHDQHDGAYRKWPWKAGRDRTLTLLPGECPHCDGRQSSSAWKAIDANLDYETVYSIGPGVVDLYEPSGGNAGKYVRVRDSDGSYITYEHLSRSLVVSGDPVVAGQPIAVSGCTGNCSGPHLHFQRHDGPGFQSNALALTRISGHGGSSDQLRRVGYTSDNGGIGYTISGEALQRMQQEYASAGGYAWGVSSNVGTAWTPCRANGQTGTWFRYVCDPNATTGGSVQTFVGPGAKKRALFHRRGATRDYNIRDGLLAAYTEVFSGFDWIYWLGYPTSNRNGIGSGVQRQTFEFGHVDIHPTNCWQRMYVRGALWNVYTFCD